MNTLASADDSDFDDEDFDDTRPPPLSQTRAGSNALSQGASSGQGSRGSNTAPSAGVNSESALAAQLEQVCHLYLLCNNIAENILQP